MKAEAQRSRPAAYGNALLAWHIGEGLLASSLLILLLYSWHVNFATAGFLQLLTVLVVALRGGFWAATVVSIFANLCLNYFFVPPVLGFTVNDPQNWVALLTFEIAAVLVSRLSARAHQQAVRAARGRREMECLYQVSRQLLLMGREPSQAIQIALILKEVFAADTVVLVDSVENTCTPVGASDALFESEVRGAGILKEEIRSASPEAVIRVLYLGARAIGSLGLKGCHLTPVTADAVANLTAIGLERARDSVREREATAELRVERLRAALLSARDH